MDVPEAPSTLVPKNRLSHLTAMTFNEIMSTIAQTSQASSREITNPPTKCDPSPVSLPFIEDAARFSGAFFDNFGAAESALQNSAHLCHAVMKLVHSQQHINNSGCSSPVRSGKRPNSAVGRSPATDSEMELDVGADLIDLDVEPLAHEADDMDEYCGVLRRKIRRTNAQPTSVIVDARRRRRPSLAREQFLQRRQQHHEQLQQQPTTPTAEFVHFQLKQDLWQTLDSDTNNIESMETDQNDSEDSPRRVQDARSDAAMQEMAAELKKGYGFANPFLDDVQLPPPNPRTAPQILNRHRTAASTLAFTNGEQTGYSTPPATFFATAVEVNNLTRKPITSRSQNGSATTSPARLSTPQKIKQRLTGSLSFQSFQRTLTSANLRARIRGKDQDSANSFVLSADYQRLHSHSASPRQHYCRRSRRSCVPSQFDPQRISVAHPEYHIGAFLDENMRPYKLDMLLSQEPPAKEEQEAKSWDASGKSVNIYVKDEDRLTLHRHPVAQSTDCIRGKFGYSKGFHVWELVWPSRQRGTHAVIGVCTKQAPMHATGYSNLVGANSESYGWDIIRNEGLHNAKHTAPWNYPDPALVGNRFEMPEKVYCILDMDEGYLAFATDEKYLGVAFRNLKGLTLYPVVCAVWGHCEITMRYRGSLDPEPRSLMDVCRRAIRLQMGPSRIERADELMLPPGLRDYVLFRNS